MVPSTGSAIMARINLSIKSINLLRSRCQDQHPYIFCERLCVKTKSQWGCCNVVYDKSLTQSRDGYRNTTDLGNGFPDQVSQGGDEGGRVSNCRHHFKLLDAEFAGLFAGFDVDFVKGLDVFRDERDGNDQQFFFS